MSIPGLDREAVQRIARLSFLAREVVEGVRAGHHRSRHFGSSVEFAEHKEYAPGDELRHIDWKLWGKADRYYVKRFEAETNLRAWIVIDQSLSMFYPQDRPTSSLRRGIFKKRMPAPQGETSPLSGAVAPQIAPASKLAHATLLAASLAHLLIHQGDQVGLMTVGGGEPVILSPRAQPKHLHTLLAGLQRAPAPGVADLGAALGKLSRRLGERAVVFLITDALEDESALFSALRTLERQRLDISLIQVLDPTELDFPFQDISRFRDPEAPEVAEIINPTEVRVAYQTELAAFLARVRGGCVQSGIQYTLYNTGTPLVDVLGGYLAERRGRGGRR